MLLVNKKYFYIFAHRMARRKRTWTTKKIQKKCQQLKSFFFKKRRLFHIKKNSEKKILWLKVIEVWHTYFSIFCYLCSYAIVTSYLEWTSYLYSIHLAYSRFALFSSGDVSFKMKIGIKKIARKIYVARMKCNGRSKFKEKIYSLRIFSTQYAVKFASAEHSWNQFWQSFFVPRSKSHMTSIFKKFWRQTRVSWHTVWPALAFRNLVYFLVQLLYQDCKLINR